MYTTTAIRCVLLAFALGAVQVAQAQDADRIDQLEKEVLTLKQRLSKIEAILGKDSAPTAAPKVAVQGEGWKSLSAWRQLRTGATPDSVRNQLGEPAKINGGSVAHWYYPNAGELTFIGDRLHSWREPN